MEQILLSLRKQYDVNISDLKIIDKEEIPQNEDITAAYNEIRQIVRIGTQYEYLARLATQYSGIEIGIEKPNGEYNGCISAIEKTGHFKEIDGIKYIDKEKSSKSCSLLFGNFAFPICDVTEEEMVKNVNRWHVEDIMRQIWFCHNPIHDETCGFCRPCQQKMECNMGWLLSDSGEKRYRQYQFLKKLFGSKFADKLMNSQRKFIK